MGCPCQVLASSNRCSYSSSPMACARVEPVGPRRTVGYDVHITRAGEWHESEATPIGLDEWLAYVASDPEMRLDGFAEARNPTTGEAIRIESPGLSVWTTWSEGTAWMDHHGGRIVVKNPDTAILRKMCAIAERLGARVQGDEGEMYPEAIDLAVEAEELRARHSRKPWWKRLFGL
jgi:hypothetical protein